MEIVLISEAAFAFSWTFLTLTFFIVQFCIVSYVYGVCGGFIYFEFSHLLQTTSL